jgi:D-arabinose 1-dehydrogenase-like Zn-dependent alcohol dehydrogenase
MYPAACASFSCDPGARPGEWLVVSGAGGLGHLGKSAHTHADSYCSYQTKLMLGDLHHLRSCALPHCTNIIHELALYLSLSTMSSMTPAIQYAKAMGLHVCAVDISDDKLQHAKRLGAEILINAKTESDPAAALKKQLGGQGAHGVVITAPSRGAFAQGVAMTRKRGTCVLIGLPPVEFPLAIFDVVTEELTIRGSFVGTRADMAEALRFAAEGQVKANIELQPLDKASQVLERLEKGDVSARVVLKIG